MITELEKIFSITKDDTKEILMDKSELFEKVLIWITNNSSFPNKTRERIDEIEKIEQSNNIKTKRDLGFTVQDMIDGKMEESYIATYRKKHVSKIGTIVKVNLYGLKSAASELN